MKKKFYVIRHGETDWNKERRLQGAKDIRLNSTGIQQAKKAVKTLENIHFDTIISSSLLRALETASIISQHTEKPLHVDSKLKERNFGSAEGQLRDELLQKANLSIEHPLESVLDENAETFDDLCKRAQQTFISWADKKPDETLLFVAHGAILSALFVALTGATNGRAENCALYVFTQDDKNTWHAEKCS